MWPLLVFLAGIPVHRSVSFLSAVFELQQTAQGGGGGAETCTNYRASELWGSEEITVHLLACVTDLVVTKGSQHALYNTFHQQLWLLNSSFHVVNKKQCGTWTHIFCHAPSSIACMFVYIRMSPCHVHSDLPHTDEVHGLGRMTMKLLWQVAPNSQFIYTSQL